MAALGDKGRCCKRCQYGFPAAGQTFNRGASIPDRLVEHGNPKQQRVELGIDADGIVRAVRSLVSGASERDGR